MGILLDWQSMLIDPPLNGIAEQGCALKTRDSNDEMAHCFALCFALANLAGDVW